MIVKKSTTVRTRTKDKKDIEMTNDYKQILNFFTGTFSYWDSLEKDNE